MTRYNYCKEAIKVIDGLIKAAQYFKYNRLPELFYGFSQKEIKRPIEYPLACSLQAWASGSIYMIVQSLLGIDVDAINNRIYLKPMLSEGINKVEIKNLKIGDNRADFILVKKGNRIKLNEVKAERNMKLIFKK